jgi:molybdopterin-guanine dinucleotide biosynthesis protein A
MAAVHKIEAFVLAGGRSTRMGREKALLELGGVPMALRLAMLVAPLTSNVTLLGSPSHFSDLPMRVIADDQPDLGPLGGIATALRLTQCDWNLILGCDLPFLTEEWLAWLIARATASSAQAVLPAGARGHVEPLCAMYHRSAHPAIAAALGRGVRKVTDGLADVARVEIPPADWKAFDSAGRLFKNMNTPADYQEVRAHFPPGPAF